MPFWKSKPPEQPKQEVPPVSPGPAAPGSDQNISDGMCVIAFALMTEDLEAAGRHAEAEETRRTLTGLVKDVLGGNPLLLLFEARELQAAGRNREAEMAYRLMVDLTREFEDPNLLKASAAGFLGKFYFQLHRYADAEPLYQQALQTYRNLPLHEQYPPYAETLQQLGVLYEATGRKAQARECYRQVAAIRQESPGG